MEKVTYILPIHKFDDEVASFVKNALESVVNIETDTEDRLIVVGPKSAIDKVNDIYKSLNGKLNVLLLENEETTDYFSQVNKAAAQCVTPYFSIIEFDDTYKPYWKKCALNYAKNGASVLIPINELVSDGNFVSFGNEISWSASFAENEQTSLGILTEKELSVYMDFFLNGSFFKTEDFISIGGFKPSLEIASHYEYLLRANYKNQKIFVVPKIGYTHTVNRVGSYSNVEYSNLSEKKGRWLIETARKEYFFKEDRNKQFEENSTEEEN